MNQLEHNNEKVTLVPENNIKGPNTWILRDEMLELIEKGAKEITFDFSNVKFIDSRGIGVMVAAFNQLNKDGGSLNVVNVSEEIMKMFAMMRLDKYLNLSAR